MGTTQLKINIPGIEHEIDAFINKELTSELLLGINFLLKYNMDNMDNMVINFDDKKILYFKTRDSVKMDKV